MRVVPSFFILLVLIGMNICGFISELSASPSINSPQQETKKNKKILSKKDNTSVTMCGKLLRKALKTPGTDFSKQCPIAYKLYQWISYRRDPPAGSFEEITKFIRENPDWPSNLLKRRAEEALTGKEDPIVLLNWFGRNPPITGKGAYAYAEALHKKGKSVQQKHPPLEKLVKRVWEEKDFISEEQEKGFIKKFKHFLKEENHLKRLRRLLSEEKIQASERLKLYLSKMHAKFIDVRIAFLTGVHNAEELFKKLPQKLKEIPDLMHDRIKWFRKKETKDTYEKAYVLLKRKIDVDALNSTLWQDRHILFRDGVRDAHNGQSLYEYLQHHGLKEGPDFSDAEFLLGFIALERLHKSDLALTHFEKLFENVGTPISKSRAAYWAGRAAEALKEKKLEKFWYSKAAQYHTTFYGQEALKKLKKPLQIRLKSFDSISLQKRKAFEARSLIKAARLLKELDAEAEGLLAMVLDYLAEQAETEEDQGLVLELTTKIAPEMRVPIARTLARKRNILYKEAYPSIFVDTKFMGEHSKKAGKAFIQAIIRKESGFSPTKKSPAGAIGLMQILPATAEDIIKENEVQDIKGPWEEHLKNPQKNLRLGCLYVDNLLRDFEGSLILVATAYNAGPGRLKKWLETYGDPTDPKVDPIVWIETLPYGETRNYIHRLLESYAIYKAQGL